MASPDPAPGSSWRARLGAAVDPTPREPDAAAAVAAARRETNVARARLLAVAIASVHALALAVFVTLTPHSPAEAAWARGLVAIHGAGLLVSVLLRAVAARRPLASFAVLRPYLGEFIMVYAVVVGIVVMFNSLRYHFTLAPWILTVLIGSVATHVRVALAVPVQLLSLVAAIAASMAASPESGVRTGLFINAATFGAMALVLSRMLYAGFVRETVARRSVELANQDLERRVNAQVGEIVAHAERIDALNRQLASQVQARSAELTVALERLVTMQHGEEAWAPGRVVAERFEIRRVLGVGGMGVVYAAFDRTGGVEVALKVVNGEHAGGEAARRFLQEANAAARLHHPAVVRLIHVDITDEGRLYQVQELVDGQPLDTWTTAGRPLPPGVVARLGATLADALAAAHADGVVHRDVKPQNIMLTREAPGCRLLDFGLAKLRSLPGGGSSQLTEHGRVVGTPQFVSPEQATDPERVAGPADVYALAVTLYLAVSGHLPFHATTPVDWLHAHAHDAPAPLGTHTPAGLAAVIMACLAKRPGDRPTARSLAALLGQQADALGAGALESWVVRTDVEDTRDLTGAAALLAGKVPPEARRTLG